MKNGKVKNLIVSGIAALAVTAICGSGIISGIDLWAQDSLYQRPEPPSPEIIVVGIDEEDIDNFGPYNSWDRSVMAEVLEALGRDPDNLPAAVAIDALFKGQVEPVSDKRLADAAARLGNVVIGTEAKIGTRRVFGTASVIEDDFAVLGYEEPYDELKNVTSGGFINSMYDTDGVLRHAQLYLEPEGGRVWSLVYETCRIYSENKGYDLGLPKTDSLGRFFVDYTGGPGDYYDNINLSKLVKGEISPSFFSGKIVIIGPYAPGFQDAYLSPVDRSRMMFGVEYQANVMQCLLDGNFKEEAPFALQLTVLALISFAFFYFCNNRRLLYEIPVLAVLLLASVGGAVFLYSLGYIVHAAWIPFSLILLFIASVAGNYIRAAIARQNVTKTFERYVAPNIVGEILKEGTDSLKLGGKLCDIAVLFVDIRGFTTMSERLSPEEVVNILNQYLSMTSACIDAHNGTLDKFIGDATMAFWGAPIEDEDPVYHAALTALDIVEGAKKLSDKLKEETGEVLNVGVGVHFGPAVVGNMGSERRMDYTAIGDTVNTSARLEANAPAGTVYISRAVADRLEGRMKFESLGDSIRLKGKAEGFEILKLIGREE